MCPGSTRPCSDLRHRPCTSPTLLSTPPIHIRPENTLLLGEEVSASYASTAWHWTNTLLF